MAYVIETAGVYRIDGSRVALDSIVAAFWNGQTPESIAQSFPTLSLEQVYGAVAYYLADRAQIDEYLTGQEADYDRARRAAIAADPALHERLAALRVGSEARR